MATKKEPAAQAVENAVETVEKVEAATEEKDDGMVTIHLFKDDDRYSAPVFVGVNGDSYLIQRGMDVKVPKAVAEVLEHSIKQDAEAARKSQAMQAAAGTQQGYQQAMANVDSGLAGLRDKALTLYQLKQNGLSGLLSALQNQDSLEAAEHQGAVANAQDWRDYKKSRADQAAQEKSDFLSNLWEMAKSVGRAGLTAYDTYKGYTQQQWENEFAREQWEYNKERTGQSDALNAYEQAFNLYQQGAGDAANAVLGRYGLDTGIFDNYSGAPITRADKAGALTTAAGLAGGGSDEAARAVLELYGLDPNSVGNYRTIAGRQLATALATKSAGSSGSSSGRRSSRTKSSGSSWTNSQLQSMAKTFSSMKENEPLYDFYKKTLTDNGWLNADTANDQSASQSGGVDMAAMLAKNYAKKGYSAWAIMNNMSQNGYSDNEIARALEKAGVKG